MASPTSLESGPDRDSVTGSDRTTQDTPVVSRFDDKKFTPYKTGGQTFLTRPPHRRDPQGRSTAFCLPNGMPRQILSPYSQQWIQAPGTLVHPLRVHAHFFRTIPTGWATASEGCGTDRWMGDSVGKWEGDTLVIDTIGLKEWVLDAYHEEASRWHSDQLHLIERLKVHRSDDRFPIRSL